MGYLRAPKEAIRDACFLYAVTAEVARVRAPPHFYARIELDSPIEGIYTWELNE
jgi:hypothetical protein